MSITKTNTKTLQKNIEWIPLTPESFAAISRPGTNTSEFVIAENDFGGMQFGRIIQHQDSYECQSIYGGGLMQCTRYIRQSDLTCNGIILDVKWELTDTPTNIGYINNDPNVTNPHKYNPNRYWNGIYKIISLINSKDQSIIANNNPQTPHLNLIPNHFIKHILQYKGILHQALIKQDAKDSELIIQQYTTWSQGKVSEWKRYQMAGFNS